MLLAYLKTTRLLSNNAQSDLADSQKIPIYQQLHEILVKFQNTADFVKLALIKKTLRYLAFANREKFPELKSSLLVKNWEREIGLAW